jgi:NADH-quinone oxidoreductase subunit C
MMNQEAIRDKLISTFGEAIKESELFRDQMTTIVAREDIVKICRYLRDDPDLQFDFLSFVGGVDKNPKEPRFEVVYQLYSIKHNHRFRIKALVSDTGEEPANVDSVFEIWPTADWHERETAEMFGIMFNNHPDPRKLLLPEHWKVFPLRKDFPLEGTEETPDLPRSEV